MILALLGTGAYTQLEHDTPYTLLAFALWLRGVGLGMTMMPAMAAAYQTLSRAAVPRATTALNIIRTIGGSFGTAFLSVVLSAGSRRTCRTSAGRSARCAACPAEVRRRR